MATNPESEASQRQMAEAVNSQAANWMKRGVALLNENTTASLSQAIQCFDRAIELRRHLSLSGNLAYAFGLAAGWVNRSDALTRLGGENNLLEALNGYGLGLALLRRLPLAEDPRYRRGLALAWLNRGVTLQAQGTPKSFAEAVQSFTQSIAILREAPGQQDPENRRLLGCALMNRGNILLLVMGPLAARESKALAHEALALLRAEPNDPGSAEAGFKARHVLCQAISYLLGDEAVSAAAKEELVGEATDAVDEGMKNARHWEQQGIDHFRPLVSDLFRFGSRIYQAHQPHFLGEFLLESLDPAHTPGAMPDNHEMHEAAVHALQRALGDIQRDSFLAMNTPRYEKILEMLQELRLTQARLAELRQRHLLA